MTLKPARRQLGHAATGLLVWTLAVSVAAQAQQVPPGGDPTLACKQTPDGRAYWTEYGFCDLAVKGPAQAKGLVLWSHGVSGEKEQFHTPPPPACDDWRQPAGTSSGSTATTSTKGDG